MNDEAWGDIPYLLLSSIQHLRTGVIL